MDTQERKRAILVAIAQMEKQFGKGSVQQLGARPALAVDTIPTGSLSLDLAMGDGGSPG